MSKLNASDIRKSLVDVSAYGVTLSGSEAPQQQSVLDGIARLMEDAGFCVCYGTNKILAKNGLDIHHDSTVAYELLESIFKGALAKLDMRKYSITRRAMEFARMDVDGYNKNQSFSFDGKVEPREFMTAKCIHFDAATPFIGNIYGPNRNIIGGYPLICDVKRFCRDKGVQPGGMVDNIPNNYNVVVKQQFYDELLNDYSFALKMNLDTDIVLIMLLNEIEFGLAHGATDPQKRVQGDEAHRPIRHFEFQYSEESHYEGWYRHYGLGLFPAKNYQGENLSLNYYDKGTWSFNNLIALDN